MSHSKRARAVREAAAISEDTPSEGDQIMFEAGKNVSIRRCTQCKATDTPQWREGPQGPKTLCNACGVKWLRQSKRGRDSSSSTPTKAQSSPRHTGNDQLKKSSSRTPTRHASKPGEPHAPASDSCDDTHWPAITTGVAAAAAAAAAGATAAPMDTSNMDERTAAMSLLCFALSEQAPPSSNEGAPPDVKEEELFSYDYNTLLRSLPSGVPDPELQQLQQLHQEVQRAYRELAAADAARTAVAKCLADKQQAAEAAKEQARVYARILHDELQQLDAQYKLRGKAPEPAAATRSMGTRSTRARV